MPTNVTNPERTHNDLWDQIRTLEGDVGVLAERLESTRDEVLSNRDEFRDRLRTLENGVGENTILISRIDEKIDTGTSTLKWMFSAGIAAMSFGLAIIGYFAT